MGLGVGANDELFWKSGHCYPVCTWHSALLVLSYWCCQRLSFSLVVATVATLICKKSATPVFVSMVVHHIANNVAGACCIGEVGESLFV